MICRMGREYAFDLGMRPVKSGVGSPGREVLLQYSTLPVPRQRGALCAVALYACNSIQDRERKRMETGPG